LFTTPIWSAPPAHDEVAPLIEMENVPLIKAIRELAERAHLNIVIDPKVPVVFERTTVSIRWHDVTPKEALTALLDNYDLVLVDGLPAIQHSPGEVSNQELSPGGAISL
jgi:hypothetical protein